MGCEQGVGERAQSWVEDAMAGLLSGRRLWDDGNMTIKS